jgi:hypothetical protein
MIPYTPRGGGPLRDHCKRAILFLSSSKILTPLTHPPSARRVCPSPATKAGGRHSPGGEGDGGSIFWKTREIGLPSYNDLSTGWTYLGCMESCVYQCREAYVSGPPPLVQATFTQGYMTYIIPLLHASGLPRTTDRM